MKGIGALDSGFGAAQLSRCPSAKRWRILCSSKRGHPIHNPRAGISHHPLSADAADERRPDAASHACEFRHGSGPQHARQRRRQWRRDWQGQDEWHWRRHGMQR
eukprot:3604850-Pyramimonas_sp.AAC.1